MFGLWSWFCLWLGVVGVEVCVCLVGGCVVVFGVWVLCWGCVVCLCSVYVCCKCSGIRLL
jgi:hypothetical protein